MTQTQAAATGGEDLAARVAAELPYLRRYARALTGSQESGDRCAALTLEMIVADRAILDDALPLRAMLFKIFHRIWSGSGDRLSGVGDLDDADTPRARMERMAQRRLARLTAGSREALLLRTIEGFPPEQIGAIMGVTASEAQKLVDAAFEEMEGDMAGAVMIIEDEPIIAMDLRSIVSAMGHSVTGVARTRDAAIRLGRETRPDLILADIQLADKSSGIDAARQLLEDLGDRPVIFITAFPERLLTGDRPEPAFLIAKPYTEEQVRSAVSQAMFFAGTDSLQEQ